MGLTQALNSANSGLTATQNGLELISRNIANADTPGYTKKSQNLRNEVLGFSSGGVRELDPTRVIDTFLQKQLRNANSLHSATEITEQFLNRVDALIGIPGETNALDSLLNDFSQKLQTLMTAPEDGVRRDEVISSAQVLANQFFSISNGIQDLRQLAEDSIAESVAEINDSLEQLDQINQTLDAAGGRAPVDVLDERDKFLDRVAQFLEIQVSFADSGRVSVFTKGGNALLEGNARTLDFDQKGAVNASALYNTDPDERGVGTIFVRNSTGYAIDLIANGAIKSGHIGALIELRDVTLTSVQDQLDEIAHGLATAFSNKDITSTAATVGAQTGFDIDLTGILAGNAITLNYTDNTGPTEEEITFIRVDDASVLPLADTVTANPNDTVIGIDFSGGFAAAIAAIDTALGANLTASNPSGNVLRIIDDGGGGLTDVDGLSAVITATSAQDDGLQIPIFTDAQSIGLAYSNSLDGPGQKLGFASRLAVNYELLADNELLVRYSTSPVTAIGSPDRPQELYSRLNDTTITFHPSSGIGKTDSPAIMSVVGFTQKVISRVTAEADYARRTNASQTLITVSLQDRYDATVGVDVDSEISQLIALQNAFSANARVVQAIQEMMQLLIQTV